MAIKESGTRMALVLRSLTGREIHKVILVPQELDIDDAALDADYYNQELYEVGLIECDSAEELQRVVKDLNGD